MELLFNFPTRRFHVRQISRILRVSPPSVSKAINELAREKLVNTKRELTYELQANLSNPEFRIMKRVYNLKMIYSSGLFNYLAEKFSLNTIILFGSYSRGEDNEKSDIDIAIDSKEKPLDLEEYEKKLDRRIHIEFFDYRKIKKELKDSIINGIVLLGYIVT